MSPRPGGQGPRPESRAEPPWESETDGPASDGSAEPGSEERARRAPHQQHRGQCGRCEKEGQGLPAATFWYSFSCSLRSVSRWNSIFLVRTNGCFFSIFASSFL